MTLFVSVDYLYLFLHLFPHFFELFDSADIIRLYLAFDMMQLRILLACLFNFPLEVIDLLFEGCHLLRLLFRLHFLSLQLVLERRDLHVETLLFFLKHLFDSLELLLVNLSRVDLSISAHFPDIFSHFVMILIKHLILLFLPRQLLLVVFDGLLFEVDDVRQLVDLVVVLLFLVPGLLPHLPHLFSLFAEDSLQLIDLVAQTSFYLLAVFL